MAKTSITIDDCIFVVDDGQMKESRFDPTKNMESLDTVWATLFGGLTTLRLDYSSLSSKHQGCGFSFWDKMSILQITLL